MENGSRNNAKNQKDNNATAIRGATKIIGIGTDIVEVLRIKKAIKKHPGFLKRIYSESELAYCTCKNNPAVRYGCLAQRFAAKEAVAKSIGSGFGKNFSFNEISVENDCSGKPAVVLYGRAKNFCKASLIDSFYISLSATERSAVAFAIAFSSP